MRCLAFLLPGAIVSAAALAQAQFSLQPGAAATRASPELIGSWGSASQCGEDELRDYRITLLLHRQRLEIRWPPDFATAALELCRSMGGE